MARRAINAESHSGPHVRLAGDSMSLTQARSTARRGRSTAGLLQTFLHRHRALRWAAACGAAIAAFAVLSSDPSNSGIAELSDTRELLAREELAARLPAATRGMSVPADGGALAPGDYVDVHASSTGAAVARNVLVVEVSGGDTVIAVPVDQVGAMVESLANDGVILVLVPFKAS